MNPVSDPFARALPLVPEGLRPAAELLAEGRALARNWRLGSNRFLRSAGVASEAEYKRREAAAGRIMQHAHIGFRSVDRTIAAMGEVRGTCLERGVRVDRFGVTLDWSMGFPLEGRAARPKGTGIVLAGAEDFARLTEATDAACHFGDFMLGLPGALDNTKAAIAAGATAIGNLGQYFTFRLPFWDDDVATTEATVTALGLIAAQDAEILVHSNLDDGFAGLFADMSSALGMVMIEKHIVETLIGARLSHCYGHHFTAPLVRLAFHAALSQVTDTVGTMIFGNTVSYKSTPAGNFASLASYLQADIWSLRRVHTGHAINPVPVTENERIPDIDEIIDAQTFAARLVEHASASVGLIDADQVDGQASKLVDGGRRFARNVLSGLAERGVDIEDAAALMIALKRIGPKALEAAYGIGEPDPNAWGGRRHAVLAEWVEELEEEAQRWVEKTPAERRARIRAFRPKVCIATSDVHEHGKSLIERILAGLGAELVEGGVSVDPTVLADVAIAGGADLVAVSTYNGIALRYARDVQAALRARRASIPLCIGGRLNQIPEDSNSGLPVDVAGDLAALGAIPCRTPDDLVLVLDRLASGEPNPKERPCASAV